MGRLLWVSKCSRVGTSFPLFAVGAQAPLRLGMHGVLNGRLRSLEATFDVSFGAEELLTASAAQYKDTLLRAASLAAEENQPLKAAQRLWSLAVITGDTQLHKALTKALSSDAAALSQVAHDAGITLQVIREGMSIPYKIIDQQASWMQRLLHTHAEGSAVSGHLDLPLKQVHSAYEHYKASAFWNAEQVKHSFGQVQEVLHPLVELQARKLTNLLPLEPALTETYMKPVSGMVPENQPGQLQTQVLSGNQDRLPSPKVVTAELPEENWHINSFH